MKSIKELLTDFNERTPLNDHYVDDKDICWTMIESLAGRTWLSFIFGEFDEKH